MRKLIFILLFLPILGLSQVPDTESYRLDTVVDIVNPTTDDLQDCFNDAIPEWFNASYYGTYLGSGGKLTLLQFRDYKERTDAQYNYTTQITDTRGTSGNPSVCTVTFTSSFSDAQYACEGYHLGQWWLCVSTSLYSKGLRSSTEFINIGTVLHCNNTDEFLQNGYYIDMASANYPEYHIITVNGGIVTSVVVCTW